MLPGGLEQSWCTQVSYDGQGTRFTKYEPPSHFSSMCSKAPRQKREHQRRIVSWETTKALEGSSDLYAQEWERFTVEDATGQSHGEFVDLLHSGVVDYAMAPTLYLPYPIVVEMLHRFEDNAFCITHEGAKWATRFSTRRLVGIEANTYLSHQWVVVATKLVEGNVYAWAPWITDKFKEHCAASQMSDQNFPMPSLLAVICMDALGPPQWIRPNEAPRLNSYSHLHRKKGAIKEKRIDAYLEKFYLMLRKLNDGPEAIPPLSPPPLITQIPLFQWSHDVAETDPSIDSNLQHCSATFIVEGKGNEKRPVQPHATKCHCDCLMVASVLQYVYGYLQPLEKVIQMDFTARSKGKAHGKVKLEPYCMSLKKVLIMPNEGGVPMEDVKHQQEVQIKREYIIPYTSQKGEVAEKPNSQH
eukprot:Gb_27868 [translate_table: standard]